MRCCEALCGVTQRMLPDSPRSLAADALTCMGLLSPVSDKKARTSSAVNILC